jgi:hypothetical protein
VYVSPSVHVQLKYMRLVQNVIQIYLASDWDRLGRVRMVVGFIATYAISAYHHLGTNDMSLNPTQAKFT